MGTQLFFAIDLTLARFVGLNLISPMRESTGAGNGSLDAIPVEVSTLRIGDHEALDLDALPVDLSALGNQLEVPLYGVSGFSLLKKPRDRSEFSCRSLSFLKAMNDLGGDVAGVVQTGMHSAADANIPVIDGLEINGISMRAALDTGSSRTATLYPSAVMQLDSGQLQSEDSTSATGTGFTGTSPYHPVVVSSVSIGGLSFGRQEVFALTPGKRLPTPENEAAVNIGSGLLKSCVLTLDYKRMIVQIHGCISVK